MTELWNFSSGTVAEITAMLNGRRARPLSTKTVLTCLTRLEAKGLVRHTKEGRAYRFFPTMTEGDAAAWHIGEGVAEMLDRFGDLAVAVFVERIGADPEHRLLVRRLLEAHDERGRP